MTITPDAPTRPGMIWLDLTRQCQLQCTHCYNESGPGGDHGTMTLTDWLRTVDQAADTGTRHVQLIGGEPTLHPNAPEITGHALNLGLSVEVYSNLVHVTDAWWTLLQQPGMCLATSYYSHDPAQHNAMTGRPASHRHTRRNLVKALSLGISTRASIITTDGTGVEETRNELETLGVTRIDIDHVRPYGRSNPAPKPDCKGLCGACGDNRASVAPDGTVSPCVFTTWMPTGNVRGEELATILSGTAMADARATIRAAKGDNDDGKVFVPCSPDKDICKPGGPPSECDPRH